MPLSLATSTKFESKKSSVTYNKSTQKNITKKISFKQDDTYSSLEEITLCNSILQYNLLVSELETGGSSALIIKVNGKNCITLNIENSSSTEMLTLQFQEKDGQLIGNATINSNTLGSYIITPTVTGSNNYAVYENKIV